MMHCPHCGWTTRHGTDCERCAATLARAGDHAPPSPDSQAVDSHTSWAMIARFGNAAEAGYFAHELAPLLNCEPRIECEDDFDAIGGAWRTRYMLTVPDHLAEQARNQLASLLDGNWEQEQLRPAPGNSLYDIAPTIEGRPASRINWVPIMLTLAAGSAVFWAGRKAQVGGENAPRGGAGQTDLFELLGDGAQPWVQRGEDGNSRRELQVNPRSGLATIFEDTDGDGRFDRKIEIPVRSR